MKYKILNNFYVGNQLYSVGQVVDIQDKAKEAELLEDGHIVAATNEDATAAAEVTADPAPLVEQPTEPELLTVQNEQIQPSQETITEDLTVAEAGSVVQPTSLEIQ